MRIIENRKGTVKAISTKNNSFILEENDREWFEVRDKEVSKLIQKGDLIEFNFELAGMLRFVDEIKVLESSKEDGILNLDSLLKSAHTKGLINITTSIIHIDYKEKFAVFKCSVTLKSNLENREILKTFEGTGDANFNDLNSQIQKSWIRMAETRAIVRALRWATNNADVAEEEK